ncbi:hypothetical protein Tco_0639380 [Tanacetum coccineum]
MDMDFMKNKDQIAKAIGSPFYEDLEKVASSFYVTNFPDSINVKELWNTFVSHGRLVDAFIVNKRSKRGEVNPKLKTTTYNIFASSGKPSSVSIVHGTSNSKSDSVTSTKTRSISLNDQDLLSINDSSRVLLVKLKEVDSMSNIHKICRNKGCLDLKIHHVGGLWIWIQFPTASSCTAFQTNESMKRLSSMFKSVSPSFKFYNSVMKDKVEYKGENIVGAFMNVPIFVGNFSVVTHFVVVENMDGYRDQDMGDVIFGEPFCKASCVEAKRFDGLITIHNGNDNVTYQMARSHSRFKYLSNSQCNKIRPLLKVSVHDKLNEISHLYQKPKSFYKGVLNLGPEYVLDAKTEEWLICGHIRVHEIE